MKNRCNKNDAIYGKEDKYNVKDDGVDNNDGSEKIVMMTCRITISIETMIDEIQLQIVLKLF